MKMKNMNERSNFVFEFRPVTELFEEQVKLHPEKCAVVSGKESFTYAQLNERANRIANSLVEKGVRREIIVGVVLERCCDFYAVRQGILKSGGAFAVATPDYPDDRIQYIFEDSGAPFIITTKEIAEELSDADITARAKEIAEISSNITQHKAVPKPDEVDMQQLTFFDTVKDDDIIRELDSLELSTMTPLDAMNTLYRLQTKLKNRWKETG